NDSSKVTSKGTGLLKAFVGQKSSFLVDCSKASSNMLLLRVHGPTTPYEEVSMKHVGNQQYNVTYIVKERGDYVLAVKWGRNTSLAALFMSQCLKTVFSKQTNKQKKRSS
ncbi:LOW QUALITY PROTEIN: filamin-B-like, partial [Rhinopithecus roxellana]|uniref:LOW QUALITY PROTEIN: filamin-B-like n=1 Tax=Rhinopithecus roxellana TaxID=61622 RepID=UPI0005335A81